MRTARSLALLAAPLLMLGGCVTAQSIGDHIASAVGLEDDAPQSYTSSAVSNPSRAGIAISDEPLAAKAGAAVLAQQGSAVDAVSTIFFTLTATYPVAAGLGGGGICLVRDANGQVAEFDFLTKAPRAGGAYAVPGAVRGFADMQKVYGALPWQRVVAPGEAYAATGFPLSQSLGARLAAAQAVVRLDAGLAAEFLDETGQPRSVGSETRNLPLAQTLGEIRLGGADAFYKGAMAARIVAYSAAQGGGISLDDLAAYASQQGASRTRVIGGLTAHMPGARTGAGVLSATMLDNVSRARGATASAVNQTLASFGVAALPQDMGSTGFAAVDANGQSAACAVTLNGPFGSGRTAADTGMQLAATPALGQAGLASAFLMPLIASNADGVALAGAGAGGPNGTAAAAAALLQAASGRLTGKHGDLRGTGTAPFDTVNMISCDSVSCAALPDPGAHGAGAAAETALNQ